MAYDPVLRLGSHTLSSRLILGTGRYPSYGIMAAALEASGVGAVTVSVRRTDLGSGSDPSFSEAAPPDRYTYIPNTAGCVTAEDAVRTLRLARALGGWTLVKLEVIGNPVTLYPDMVETLRAAEQLIAEGFEVMPYCTDDPVLCQRLEAMGCVAVMPMAAPIGSGLGIQNPLHLRMMCAQSRVPVLVDAGIGSPSHVVHAMECGCAGVLLNTAVACASDPVGMATAMAYAVRAGRWAYESGIMKPRPLDDATHASSPGHGLLTAWHAVP